jgi:integrase
MDKAKAFTALTVRSIKAVGYHKDCGDGAARGLLLQVRKAGAGGGFTRSWLYRFTSPVHRKERWMGLGPADVIGLAEARDLARIARRLVTLGTDPIDHRDATVQAERDAALREKARRMTFAQCSEGYMAAHLPKHRCDTHRHQWRLSLRLACEAFGDLPVAQVDTAMVTKFLEPIWRKTPNSAMRHRGRVENVLDWATVHKFRQGDNPARWNGHLEHVFAAKPKPVHLEAMPFVDVPAFLRKLREHGVCGAAVEFMVLTASRRGEALDAKWSEFDLDKRLWTVPPERMKKGVEHHVPLSDRALTILKSLPRNGELVFQNDEGKHRGKRIGHTSMRKLLVKLAGNGPTLHGFRSAFRDWAGETTSYDREVIEHALAHQLPDETERAYRRDTALQKRKRLMQSWSDHCCMSTSTVVPLRA